MATYVADASNHRIQMVKVDMPIISAPEVLATSPANGSKMLQWIQIAVVFQVVDEGDGFNQISLKAGENNVDIETILAEM